MKTIFKILALSAIHLSLIYGNGGPPPPLPFISADVSGPPHRAPLFLTDTNRVTIFAQFSVFTPSSVDGTVKVEGTRSVFTSNTNNNNLEWKISNAAFNVGINIKAWKRVAVFATLKIDSRESGITATGSDFGIGILISPDKDFRARLDLGFTYLSTDVVTRLQSGSGTDTLHSVVTKNNKVLDPFLSLTMNTAFEDWLINPFFQASFYRQTLFHITSNTRDVYSTVNLFTLTPGITYRLNKNMLLIIGGNYFIPSDLGNRSSQAIFSAFAQINFLLL